MFLATLLLQMTFQTFSTWFALHATERFAVRPEEVAIGFIAWAIGGVIGAIPAGAIGVRFGRRTAMLARVRPDVACLFALDRVTTLDAGGATAGAGLGGWTLPTVECLSAVRRAHPGQHRGMLAACTCCAWRSAAPSAIPQRRLFDLVGGTARCSCSWPRILRSPSWRCLLVPRGAGRRPTPAPMRTSTPDTLVLPALRLRLTPEARQRTAERPDVEPPLQRSRRRGGAVELHLAR